MIIPQLVWRRSGIKHSFLTKPMNKEPVRDQISPHSTCRIQSFVCFSLQPDSLLMYNHAAVHDVVRTLFKTL